MPKKKGPGGRKQWAAREAGAGIASQRRNHAQQTGEAGPARTPRRMPAKSKESVADQVLTFIRNRKESRADARTALARRNKGGKAAAGDVRAARRRYSSGVREADRLRAETAAEVVDPATGRTKQDDVETRVKRRGLTILRRKLIDPTKGRKQ